MKMIYESVTKNTNGIIDVSVLIQTKDSLFKRYSYSLRSYFFFKKFLSFYNKKYYGRALQVLKVNKIVNS